MQAPRNAGRLFPDVAPLHPGYMHYSFPTGIAPNRGADTRLRDVVLAVQTEIPLIKQHLSDQLWARRGGGMQARRFNRLSGARDALSLQPSRADTIAHGFATVVRFFPGARDTLAAIDDEVVKALVPPAPGRAGASSSLRVTRVEPSPAFRVDPPVVSSWTIAVAMAFRSSWAQSMALTEALGHSLAAVLVRAASPPSHISVGFQNVGFHFPSATKSSRIAFALRGP